MSRRLRTCPDCKGLGEVRGVETEDWVGLDRCETCGGSGSIPEPRKKPARRKFMRDKD